MDLLIICLWFACAFIGAAMGSSSNRAGTGLLLGFLFGPIGLLIMGVLISGSKPQEQSIQPQEPTMQARIYKARALLDTGHITQDKYEATRQRILVNNF